MTHVRKRPTKTAIRHVADLVAAAFEERGAEIEGPVYRYDEDADPGERHVYDLGATFTSAAGVMEYDLIVSASGVLVDEVEPDGPVCDYLSYETAEFFETAVPLLPDLRPTSIALDLLALYRRHGAVVLDPKTERNIKSMQAKLRNLTAAQKRALRVRDPMDSGYGRRIEKLMEAIPDFEEIGGFCRVPDWYDQCEIMREMNLPHGSIMYLTCHHTRASVLIADRSAEGRYQDLPLLG